jgi:hypothetical protein
LSCLLSAISFSFYEGMLLTVRVNLDALQRF